MRAAKTEAGASTAPIADTPTLKTRLSAVQQHLQNATRFQEGWQLAEADLRDLLGAAAVRCYRHEIYNPEIVAIVETGGRHREIRHLLSPASVAGYTALAQEHLVIADVSDHAALAAIHPQLRYDRAHDEADGVRISSLISVPLLVENAILGVLQAGNPKEVGRFTPQHLTVAKAAAAVLARKIRNELNKTRDPFEHLVNQGRITAQQLDELRRRASVEKQWVTALMRSELDISAEDIGRSLEKYYQVPFHAFDPKLVPPKALVQGISTYYLKSRLWLPIRGNPDRAVVVMSDPGDSVKIREIQERLKVHSFEFQVGLPEDILAYLGRDTAAAVPKPPPSRPKLRPADIKIESDVDGSIGDASAAAIRLVNEIIVEAHRQEASDIHIEPSAAGSPADVRMRVDGVCRKAMEIPDAEVRSVISRIKIMSGLDIAERRKPQDGKAKVKVQGQALELRTATVPTIHGESVVLRLLASSGALPFDKLNLSDRNAEEIHRIVQLPHGLFLVVGPTGSGKTTTLHAILGVINTPDRKIWTAEDPVEITQQGLQQVQVVHKIGLDFASVMRSFLRADPDVILIGEMRDFETANIGIESSLTGHLVFSTLHTNSAPETIVRLLDLGLDPFNFSDALLAVLAQRLVRTLCPNCKEPYQPTDAEIQQLVGMYGAERFPELGVKAESVMLPKPVGCSDCGESGYRGRTGLHELLVASPRIKQMVAKRTAVEDMRKQALAEGMRTIVQDGVSKIFKGDTDIRQLHRVAAE